MKNILKRIITRILEWEARIVLKKYKPYVIAITGSVGKTSTKDAVYAAVSGSFFVRRSEKSYNSELGIPLTILGCSTGWGNPLRWIKNIVSGLGLILLKNHYPKILVLEVGADRPGDIKSVARWLAPRMVIMTQFADVPVHVEFFASAADLFEEKAALAGALAPGGVLVLNDDDPRVRTLRERALESVNVISYGFEKGAMVHASHAETLYTKDRKPSGMIFKVSCKGNTVPIKLSGAIGIQHAYAALAAFSAGFGLGVNLVSVAERLAEHISPPGRLRIITGIKGSTIIDDSYNSSPVALRAALTILGELTTGGKKIAILGDMLELGSHTAEEHKKAGEHAGKVCNLLLVVGPRARYMVEGALLGGLAEKNIIEFDNARAAGKYLESVLEDGDIVLVKGSQQVRCERAVEEIMAHPEDRNKLLVRQEEEWLRR